MKTHAHQGPAGDCRHCGRTMRWADEPPGRPVRGREGECSACVKHAGYEDQRPQPGRPDTTMRDRDWIDAYVRRRRRMGVSPDGVLMEGEHAAGNGYVNAWERPTP